MNEEELRNWYRNNFNKLKEEPPAGVWKNIADNLEFQDGFKNNFNKLNEEPPAEVWQNVSNQLDFQDWYKNTFNKLQEEPPAEVWENVSNGLDVKDVWNNVSGRLDVIARRKQVTRWLAYAASALLLLIGGTWLLNPGSAPNEGKTLAALDRAADHLIVYHNAGKNTSKDRSHDHNNSTPDSNNSGKNYAYNGNNSTDHNSNNSNPVNDPHSGNNSADRGDHKNNSPDKSHSGDHSYDKNHNKGGTIPHQKDKKKYDHPGNNGTKGGKWTSHYDASGNPEDPGTKRNNKPGGDLPVTPVPLDLIDLYPVYVSVNMPYANLHDTGFLPNQDGVDGKSLGLDDDSPFHGFYGGLSFTYSNTWLLNKRTITAYSRTNLTQANVHLTHAFG